MQLTELIIRVVSPHYVRQDYCSPVSNGKPREVTNETKDTLVLLSTGKNTKSGTNRNACDTIVFGPDQLI